jgi:UDP-N-acetylglucosamine--dolichyl-phosphate N-acetylglucosaminephosphotransferase
LNLFLLIMLFGASAILTYKLTGYLIPRLMKRGIVGVDVHKLDRPVRAEMGGLSILISASLVALAVPILEDPVTILFFSGFATILLVGLVGILDDIYEIRQRYKPFLVAAATSPLAATLSQRAYIDFPLIGHVPFGVLYPLVVVPLGVTMSANFSNMLAGFNGLEAGTATTAIAALSILSWVRGNLDGAVIGAIFVGGYIAFLFYNWYPARIFPGDTGTLMAGATIATIGMVGQLEFAAIVVSMPAALDFTLKMLSKRPFSQTNKFGNSKVIPTGRLVAAPYPALAHAFMKVAHLTEKKLVESLLIMECVYGFLAIVLTQMFL